MSSQIAAVRDAVVTAINTAAATPNTFSQTFTAKAKYIPVYDLATTDGLVVSVVPSSYTRANKSRSAVNKSVDIDIGIQKRLLASTTDPSDPEKLAEIDALLAFAEELADFFHPGSGQVGSTGFFYLTATIPDPLYDSDQMRHNHTFVSVVTVTFFKP